MTQPPDDAALVAGSPATDARGNFVIPDASDLLRRMHNATERTIGIGRGIRDMRDSSRTVPITVRELRYVEQMVSDAATALEAKDRRIADLEAERESLGLGCDANNGGLHDAMSQGKYWFCPACGMSLRRHMYTLPHIKPNLPRAALEPSDKGVGNVPAQ